MTDEMQPLRTESKPPSRRGRPRTNADDSHSLTVIITAEDYQALTGIVGRAQRENPGYSLAALVRHYVQRGLQQDDPGYEPPEPAHPPAECLRRAARSLHLAALEIELKQKTSRHREQDARKREHV